MCCWPKLYGDICASCKTKRFSDEPREDMSNKEIAISLGVSIKAIEKHMTKAISRIGRICRKLIHWLTKEIPRIDIYYFHAFMHVFK